MASYTITRPTRNRLQRSPHDVREGRGQFKKWSAQLAYDAATPANTKLEAEIEVASVDTGEASATATAGGDFFDAEKFPGR